MRTLEPYSVEAYNLSKASENKIHDDTVAQRLGFTGGLVPGVEVFAYAAHAPAAHWGRAWLERGALEMRFLAPVYDGRCATVEAHEDDGGLSVAVICDGKLCASGHAAAPRAFDVALEIPDNGRREPPDAASRPSADESSLAPGMILCSNAVRATPEIAVAYIRDVREQDGIYAREKLMHPGWLLRRCNALLVDNVVLQPWIHVGSAMQFLSAAHVGETIEARAAVVANYERKGHRLVELDAVVLANAERPVARVRHTAIYRLRGS